MAKISSKIIFITTSPRTPTKMIPEIKLLNTHFAGKRWDHETQVAFMQLLKEENFFNGKGIKDPAFSARDRINRAPKSLGFVTLSPTITLTPAGQELIRSKRTEEIFLRQLLKFQVPSPYHKLTKRAADFWVKPYLELFRLIRHFGSLKFDEVMIFGLQLTNYHRFNRVVSQIEEFRNAKAQHKGSYKVFRGKYLNKELTKIYADEITSGNTNIRETQNSNTDKFLRTKARNMRDYTDACFRYLRATGVVNISHVGNSISIAPESMKEVDYFLSNTEREPCFIDDEQLYSEYLGNSQVPLLLTDDKKLVISKIRSNFQHIDINEDISLSVLKDILYNEVALRKKELITKQITEIKNYQLYDEINDTFEQIKNKTLYDAPLMLEWNTWRAMTMLDGGDIKANLKFDDFGNPMATAQGNMADIICDYGDFGLAVEVTMQSGQRQYEMEGEPVARHLAKLKKETNKPAYCLFIAPKINEACIAHFFALHKLKIRYYGGYSTIIPIPLNVFQKMLEDSYKASYSPESSHVKDFFEYSNKVAAKAENEKMWHEKIINKALNWLG